MITGINSDVKSDDDMQFLDLGAMLVNGLEPPAQLVEGLLYQEGIHSVYSPGGTGKTILALWLALRAVQQGLTVIYVDEENGFEHMAELIQGMGADNELISKHFKYAPAPGLTAEDAERWKHTVQMYRPALVVFDSFADHLALAGLSENSSTDITAWIQMFAQPVKDNGGAALILDHVAKESNGTGARGSTAKLAKVDVAWKLTLKDGFNRNTVGKLTLKRDKDRKGSLPQQHSFKVGGDGLGNLVFDQEEVVEPRADGLKPSEVKILAILQKHPGMTRKQWLNQCVEAGIPEGTFKPAVPRLKPTHVYEDKDKRLWAKDIGYSGYQAA